MPIDSSDKVPISKIQVFDWFHRGQYQYFFVPNFLCPCLPLPQIIFSELCILLGQPSQLSVQGRHGDFSFRDRVCALSRSRSLFPLDKVPSTLEPDSSHRTSFLAPRKSALSHGLTTLDDACCWLPLAAAGR